MFRGMLVKDIDNSVIIRVKGYPFVGHKRPPNVQRKDPNAKLIIAGDINQLDIRDFVTQHALSNL